MANKKFNRILRGIWRKIENPALYVLAGLAYILLVISLIIINPLVVWVLALIAPRWVARLAYSDNVPWTISFDTTRWIRKFLPWRCRKCYMDEAANYSLFSSKDRVRFCGEVNKEIFSKLSCGEKLQVFDAYPDLHDYCVVNGISLCGHWFEIALKEGLVFKYALKNELTIDQWKILLESKSHANLVYNIIMHKTPSEQVLMMMARKSDDWFEYLIVMLKRHGISKNSINEMLKLLSVEKQADVKQALRAHRQVAQIKSTASCWQSDQSKYEAWFKTFLSNETAGLDFEAQAAMSTQQYKLYHETGYRLDAEACILILKGGARDLIETMFKLEDQHGLYNDEAKELVNLDKDLNDIFLMILNDKE